MRILFVTPRLPLPADTGAKIRTFNLLKNVAKDNKVALLSFYFEENQKAVEDLKALGIEAHLVKAAESIHPFSIFSQRPVSIEKYRSVEMENRLKGLTAKNNFDLLHFDHLHMGQYRDCANGLSCILDEHNVESVILERCADAQKNLFRKWLFKSQAKKMAGFEAGLSKRFSKCLTVSETDKKNLAELSGEVSNIEVIPNGVDTEYFKSHFKSQCYQVTRSPKEDALAYTGSMDWLPNNDAVMYFYQEILPLIWLKNDKVKFYVVGKNPSNELLRLSKQDKRIVVTGSVDDVRPYIARAKVFVVPLRIGGGSRLKILEAMGMEKAVVSTTIGAEGIDYTEDINILLADNPQSFADKILSLLNHNGAKVKEIGVNARKLVCNQYDWGIITGKLNNIYREALNAG
jgi:sugar transferase (PEP-CTERM/EpsH1 system associated)